jgi:hypothetical protein
LERVLDKFSKYHTKILLRDFNVKVGREDIFKLTIGNESLHEISHDNGGKIMRFILSKNLTVKSTMFPHQYTLTFPDAENYSQIAHMLVDRRRHWSVLEVGAFGGADCDSGFYLEVAKVREGLAVNKQRSHAFHMERFNLQKSNEVEDKELYHAEVSNLWKIWTQRWKLIVLGK